MDDIVLQQRINIKFLVNLAKMPDFYRMQEVKGKGTRIDLKGSNWDSQTGA
jgi:hypothetical protein